MKIFVRIVLSILLVAFALIAAVVIVALIDAFGGASPEEVTNVTYALGDGSRARAYLALPPSDTEEPAPAVILLHEWWGLNEEIAHIADELAAEGYVVLAPDAYGGRLAQTVPGALFLRLGADMAAIQDRLSAGLDALVDGALEGPDGGTAAPDGLPRVDGDRIGAVGFCFGGDMVLWLGQERAADLASLVMYYGGETSDPDELLPLKAAEPILGIFGAEDAQIPVAEVEAFESTLDRVGIANQVVIYPGVGHAFLNAENMYDEGPAGQAWRLTLEHLADHVAGPRGPD